MNMQANKPANKPIAVDAAKLKEALEMYGADDPTLIWGKDKAKEATQELQKCDCYPTVIKLLGGIKPSDLYRAMQSYYLWGAPLDAIAANFRAGFQDYRKAIDAAMPPVNSGLLLEELDKIKISGFGYDLSDDQSAGIGRMCGLPRYIVKRVFDLKRELGFEVNRAIEIARSKDYKQLTRENPFGYSAPKESDSAEETRSYIDRLKEDALSDCLVRYGLPDPEAKKTLSSTYVALVRAFRLYPDIRYDTVIEQFFLSENGEPFSLRKLCDRLNSDFFEQGWVKFATKKEVIREAMESVRQSKELSFDSRKTYFDSLSWSGTTEEALSFLTDELALKRMQVATAFESLLIANHFVGMTARVHVPGSSLQAILVLQGVGLCRKSSFWESIARNKFADLKPLVQKQILDPDEKRWLMLVKGKQMVLVDEMQQITKTEFNVDLLKNIISASSDGGVRMNGDSDETNPRSFGFVGCVNKQKFLPAGCAGEENFPLARRFMPVRTLATETNPIDTDWVEQNRDQVWAAANHLYKSGYNWLLSGAHWDTFREHIKLFIDTGETEEHITSWMVRGGEYGYKEGNRYTYSDLLKNIYGASAKRQDKEALTLWLKSPNAIEWGWITSKSKGITRYRGTRNAEGLRQELIEGESEVSREADSQTEAQSEIPVQPKDQAIAVEPHQPQLQPIPISENSRFWVGRFKEAGTNPIEIAKVLKSLQNRMKFDNPPDFENIREGLNGEWAVVRKLLDNRPKLAPDGYENILN